MRTINLSCKILAPFVVGHLFEWFKYLGGAIFIATWNVISAICEYYLLYVIFSLVPELATKKDSKAGTIVESINPGPASKPRPPIITIEKEKEEKLNPEVVVSLHPNHGDGGDHPENERNNNGHDKGHLVKIPLDDDSPPAKGSDANNNEDEQPLVPQTSGSVQSPDKDRFCCKCCGGWRAYFTHHVKFAGLGLAFLYMTVLSFDNVTVGYLATQGVSAAMVGNLTAVSALVGILGSLSFPFFRKKLGKNVAGLVGFGMETLCLLLCVFSIFAPGSPFKLSSISRITENPPPCRNKTGLVALSLQDQWKYHSNIFLLMAGVVLARYGLWIADLSVTQTFQEKVHESKRGVMGGVQGSLNQLMSLLKFSLTMVLPYPDTFGYLICLSWSFVFLG